MKVAKVEICTSLSFSGLVSVPFFLILKCSKSKSIPSANVINTAFATSCAKSFSNPGCIVIQSDQPPRDKLNSFGPSGCCLHILPISLIFNNAFVGVKIVVSISITDENA